MNNARFLFSVALFAGLATGCTSRRQDTVAANLPSPDLPRVGAVQERLLAPMSLSLSARAGADTVELKAVLRVEGRLPVAPVLKIHVSEPGALLEGLAEEAVAKFEPGSIVERRFVVRAGSVPVRVTADAVTNAMGAHAEAQWPEPNPTKAQGAEMTPVAPLKIHGVTIDKAINVTSPADGQPSQ